MPVLGWVNEETGLADCLALLVIPLVRQWIRAYFDGRGLNSEIGVRGMAKKADKAAKKAEKSAEKAQKAAKKTAKKTEKLAKKAEKAAKKAEKNKAKKAEKKKATVEGFTSEAKNASVPEAPARGATVIEDALLP